MSVVVKLIRKKRNCTIMLPQSVDSADYVSLVRTVAMYADIAAPIWLRQMEFRVSEWYKKASVV
jgi:hypothetical protein